MRFFEEKCFGCGRCEELTGLPPAALAGREAGEKEQAAADRCLGGALTVSGRPYTSWELMELLERDRDFYGGQGGVTFSGGEPAAQPEFLEEMLDLCRKREIHTALDTCGYAPLSVYERLLPLCDLILFDLKGIRGEDHRRGTGRDNSLILKNFRAAAGLGTPIWVRIPLIPGFCGEPEQLVEIADFLEPYRQAVERVTLIPYHSLGQAKYRTLGLRAEEFSTPADEIIDNGKQLFLQRGFWVER